MAVAGCTKCIKYMLFFFNFIFWLAGGVILGVALWLRHDSQTSNLLILQFEGQQAPSTFYIRNLLLHISTRPHDPSYCLEVLVLTFVGQAGSSGPYDRMVRIYTLEKHQESVYILIAVGAVMMLVGFLGCYGAIQESQCLLGTFFFFLVILFACEVAAAIWGFMNRDTMSKELIHFYDSAYIKAVDVTGSPSKDAAIGVLGAFHTTLNCCGKGDDTLLFMQVRATLCPSGILSAPKPKSCHSELVTLFSEKLHLIGLAALVVAVIMIFEMIFTMVLCCGIRNSPGVY